MDLFKPRGAQSTRRPTTDTQMHGQVYNPPRYAHLGGLASASKIGGKTGLEVKKPGDGHKVI